MSNGNTKGSSTQDQYVALPDGRYVQIPAGASQDQLAAFKNKLAASYPDLKTGRGMQEKAQEQARTAASTMKESSVPKYVRGAMAALPAAGAMVGGALASPGIVTTAGGAGLGAMAGKQGELLANRVIFGPDETSPISGKGLLSTGIEGASYAIPTAATEAATRALLDQPMETGLRMAAPQYGEAITTKNLAAQRGATREGEEKLGAFMNRGYKPTIAGPSLALPEGASLSSNPKPTGQVTIAAPSESPTTSTGPKVQFAAPGSTLQKVQDEGIRGSVAKPGGRLVLSPEEAAAQDQMQNIAKTRASQHGMMYAAGMRPSGGRVPMTPTGVQTIPYPDPAEFQDLQRRIAAPDEEEVVSSIHD